jgi:hypothetical protein
MKSAGSLARTREAVAGSRLSRREQRMKCHFSGMNGSGMTIHVTLFRLMNICKQVC